MKVTTTITVTYELNDDLITIDQIDTELYRAVDLVFMCLCSTGDEQIGVSTNSRISK